MDDSEEDFHVTQSRAGRLGGGAMGAVFRATFRGEAVAAKTFHALSNPMMYGLDSAEQLGGIVIQAKVELDALAALGGHGHIVGFRGVVYGECYGIDVPKWICMELCEGGSLRDRIHGGSSGDRAGPGGRSGDVVPRMPLAEISSIGRQIASGLAFLHAKDFVHRDIKPDNIMLTATGIIKIGDLGLSTIVRSIGTVTTGAMTMCGTPLYAAPEIATGRTYGWPVDIYSFGLVLCELALREEPPLAQHLREAFVARAASSREYELADVVHSATRSASERRPMASALEVQLDKLATPRVKLRINVLADGGSIFPLEVEATVTVLNLRRRIAELLGSRLLTVAEAESRVRLVFEGAILADASATVAELDLASGSVLQVVITPPPQQQQQQQPVQQFTAPPAPSAGGTARQSAVAAFRSFIELRGTSMYVATFDELDDDDPEMLSPVLARHLVQSRAALSDAHLLPQHPDQLLIEEVNAFFASGTENNDILRAAGCRLLKTRGAATLADVRAAHAALAKLRATGDALARKRDSAAQASAAAAFAFQAASRDEDISVEKVLALRTRRDQCSASADYIDAVHAVGRNDAAVAVLSSDLDRFPDQASALLARVEARVAAHKLANTRAVATLEGIKNECAQERSRALLQGTDCDDAARVAEAQRKVLVKVIATVDDFTNPLYMLRNDTAGTIAGNSAHRQRVIEEMQAALPNSISSRVQPALEIAFNECYFATAFPAVRIRDAVDLNYCSAAYVVEVQQQAATRQKSKEDCALWRKRALNFLPCALIGVPIVLISLISIFIALAAVTAGATPGAFDSIMQTGLYDVDASSCFEVMERTQCMNSVHLREFERIAHHDCTAKEISNGGSSIITQEEMRTSVCGGKLMLRKDNTACIIRTPQIPSSEEVRLSRGVSVKMEATCVLGVKTPGTFRVARPGDVIVHYGPRQRPTTGELPTKWNGGGNIKLAVTDFIEFQLRSSHGEYNLNPEILEMCFTPSDASISCTLESDTFCSAESMWLLVNGSTWMGAGIAILIVGFLWVFVWDYTTTPLLTTWDYITTTYGNDFWCVGMAKLKAQVDGYTRTELIGACKKAGVRPLNGTSAVMRGQLIKRVRSGGIEIVASMIFGVVFLVHQVFNMAWASFGWTVFALYSDVWPTGEGKATTPGALDPMSACGQMHSWVQAVVWVEFIWALFLLLHLACVGFFVFISCIGRSWGL